MLELTQEELKNWRSQFATSNQDIMGLRIPLSIVETAELLNIFLIVLMALFLNAQGRVSSLYKFFAS